MDSIKTRDLFPALMIILFFGLCIHFARKAQEGPWHATAVELWEKEEWHKLRALGENLYQVGKEDVESFYLAMLASEQIQDLAAERLFASRLSDARVLNWTIEKRIPKSYQPESLKKRIGLFRARIVFIVCVALFVLLVLSWRRSRPYKIAPAIISAAGILVLIL